jgi:hypothetical protein
MRTGKTCLQAINITVPVCVRRPYGPRYAAPAPRSLWRTRDTGAPRTLTVLRSGVGPAEAKRDRSRPVTVGQSGGAGFTASVNTRANVARPVRAVWDGLLLRAQRNELGFGCGRSDSLRAFLFSPSLCRLQKEKMCMPRSKHRHKAGGKSVTRPGQRRPVKAPPVPAGQAAWDKFGEVYYGPFHKRWPGHDAGYMLDIIAEDIFDEDTASFRATSKKAVFDTFLEPVPDFDGSPDPSPPSSDQAEPALNFLLQEEMIVIDGDAISIHPRFQDVMTRPLAHDGANEGQDPTSSAG